MRNAEIRPGEKVELGDSASLIRLQVLQIEAANQVILAPDVLGHKMDLRGQEEWSAKHRNLKVKFRLTS